ncbi:MAG: RdgB/HAM1 family non-canonical purine NTP pyrophosphatase [Dehalococcoidia bacterium]
MPELLLATSNPGKIREYRTLLHGVGYTITTPLEKGIEDTVTESGDTYEQNARLKAVAYAGLSGIITLADDSGLEVDALDGLPGVRSARFAGEDATDQERVSLLLDRLSSVPWEERTARFKCVIAIASRGDHVDLCYGECRGLIAFEAAGIQGFGYDPVFYLPEIGRTMAELPPELKNQISHRALASQQARRVLLRLNPD